MENKRKSKSAITLQACNRCRQRKVKCSGEQPCVNCIRRKEECVYSKRKDRNTKSVDQAYWEQQVMRARTKAEEWKNKYFALLHSQQQHPSQMQDVPKLADPAFFSLPLELGQSDIAESSYTMDLFLHEFLSRIQPITPSFYIPLHHPLNFSLWKMLFQLTKEEYENLGQSDLLNLAFHAIAFAQGAFLGRSFTVAGHFFNRAEYILARILSMSLVPDKLISNLIPSFILHHLFAPCFKNVDDCKDTLLPISKILDILGAFPKMVDDVTLLTAYTAILPHSPSLLISYNWEYIVRKCIPLLSEMPLFTKVTFMYNAVRSFFFNTDGQKYHIKDVKHLVNSLEAELMCNQREAFIEYHAMYDICKALIEWKTGTRQCSTSLVLKAKKLASQSSWSSYPSIGLAFSLPDALALLLVGEGKSGAGKTNAALELVGSGLTTNSIPLPFLRAVIQLNQKMSLPHSRPLEAIVCLKMADIRQKEAKALEEYVQKEREKLDKERMEMQHQTSFEHLAVDENLPVDGYGDDLEESAATQFWKYTR